MSDWLTKWEAKVRTEDDLIRYLDDVGFCTIDPPTGLPSFPNQADAMGLDSALGNTWFWKDDLHIQKRLYYTRLFFNRPGYISMGFLSAFIATNGEVADELMLMGRMPVAQQAMYELVDRRGPVSSKELRETLTGDMKKQSAAALIALERIFIVTKTNLTWRTRHDYGYVWDLAERWVPWAFEEADRLGAKQAREKILERFRANGTSTDPQILAAACGRK